ncbi:MAG: 50S ribosomal protein L34 [Candidatus Omnitrophica bacterium]|nr:50S ribosomal protein L34 [Candidatus Omnitrophota bacterium]
MKKGFKTPTNIIAKRRHGFRWRMRTKAGRDCLRRRRRKKRYKLSI